MRSQIQSILGATWAPKSAVLRGSAVALAMSLAVVSVTGAQTPPKTSDFLATVVAEIVPGSVERYFCIGADGRYQEFHATIVGPTTSTDPRFEGTWTGKVQILVNQSTLDGSVRDDFEIRDATGALKAQGAGFAVWDGAGPFRGLVLAKLADGSTTIANLSIVHYGQTGPSVVNGVLGEAGVGEIGLSGPVVVEFGSDVAPGPSSPAIIQGGACSGKLLTGFSF